MLEYLYCKRYSKTFSFVILLSLFHSGYSWSSLNHCQVACLHCEGIDSTSIRVIAKASAKFIMESIQTETAHAVEVNPEAGFVRGVLYFDLYEANGEPLKLLEEKPTNLLILYHYRKYGNFPRYISNEFSEEWVRKKLDLVYSESGGVDAIGFDFDNIILASTVCNAANTVSLHIMGYSEESLKRTVAALRSTFKLSEELESLPSIDEEEDLEVLLSKINELSLTTEG